MAALATLILFHLYTSGYYMWWGRLLRLRTAPPDSGLAAAGDRTDPVDPIQSKNRTWIWISPPPPLCSI